MKTGPVKSAATTGILLGGTILVLLFISMAAIMDSHEDGRYHPDCLLCLFLANGQAPDVQVVCVDIVPEMRVETRLPEYAPMEIFSQSVDLTCILPHAPPLG
ncbi:MAG: hypothetical protein JXQ27_05585 [Acidobacteria bacterium]|nr:hypothetical protein [Acidobacteriota bacterium]